MSTRDDQAAPPAEELETTAAPEPAERAAAGLSAKRKLDLEAEITDAGPCKKHLRVTIAPEEVERQFTESLGSMRREAAVPGFRPGRAPTTLVMKRFRKEVQGQVKSALLLAALEQLDDEHKLNPIARPDLDPEAIELPESGPLAFEMDVEVQPDFPLPAYKALAVQRPVRALTDADIEAQLKVFLERYAQEVPKLEGGAAIGDFVTADLTFHAGGVPLNQVKETRFRLQPELRFQDGRVPDLAGALVGARPGDVREARAEIGSSSPDPALRGQAIGLTIRVLDLKTLRLPEVTPAFLRSVGFDDEEELRRALRAMLQRRLDYQQRRALRQAILDQLIAEVPFDLPEDLVKRQEQSTLRSLVLEMRQGGISENEIRAREAEIRANAHEATLRNLKEFFILSRIAEAEGLKVEEGDLQEEIEAIAARTDETPRRIRARIEKEGLADSLASQILERKALARILEFTQVEEVALAAEERAVETLDQTASAAAPAGAEGAPAR